MSAGTKAKPRTKLQPMEDRVVIMPTDEAESMRGGLYIPDTAKEKPTQGEVIAVGPGRVEKGTRVAMDLKVGDTVIYGKYSGTPFTLDGEEVIIIKASDVLAKIG
ncbi:MAG TPA: co-chaperone GroES [Gemmatimonadales bacterium]|jgi:chaperonin GroES|nr:co-chaperone GroES [Gemmatimonadales bacterium]